MAQRNIAHLWTRTIVTPMSEIDAAIRDRVSKITREAAEEIAEIARELAPRSKRRYKRGRPVRRLKDSIFVIQDKGDWLVFVKAPHAGYVEYGTRKMAAQPYLRPAVNAVRQRSTRRLGQVQAGLGKTLGVSRTRVRRS